MVCQSILNNIAILFIYMELHKKSKTASILIALLLFLLLSCDGFFIPDTNKYFSSTIAVTPNLGTVGTDFSIKVHKLRILHDTIDDLSYHEFRWDYDNDGNFDTDWLEDSSTEYSFSKTGTHEIIVEIKTPGLEIYTDTVNIYVQDLIRVSSNNFLNDQTNSDWSLDGSNRVAFEAPAVNIDSEQPCDNAIWIVDFPGGEPKQVTNNCAKFPEWSSDGKYILFRRGTEFWVMDLELDTEHLLFEQESVIPLIPSWLPKSNKLVYSTLFKIIVYQINNGFMTTIPTDITYNLVAWSPDGQEIAGATRNGVLSAIDIYDEEEEKLTRSYPIGFAYHGEKLDWSSNRKWLSIGFADNDNTIYLIDLTNGDFKLINIASLQQTGYASFSHDSKFLIFQGQAPGENSAIWAIELPEDF